MFFPEQLTSLIDELISAKGGGRVKPDCVRRPLVLEGIGGSGRSALLQHTWKRWGKAAPIAFVDPMSVGNDGSGSMRDVLVAVMLGLTDSMPEYKISFPRVMLAHIAMDGAIDGAGDPVLSVQNMMRRINSYRDRDKLITLFGGLARAAVSLLNIPGGGIVAGLVAEQMVERLERTRWSVKLVSGDALDWFGHQDQDFLFSPPQALVSLSVRAQSADESVQQDVDLLLVTALLADLRESFARAKNHPAKAVVLLDNGDNPAAEAFVSTLARARRRLHRHHRPPDPLTVIVASGGLLVADGQTDQRPAWSESDLEDLTADDIARAGALLRVRIRGFTVEDIESMEAANSSQHLGSKVIASTIHRLTGGHAESSVLLLENLVGRPEDEHCRLIKDLGALVATIEPQPRVKLYEYLIDKITSGLSRRRVADSDIREGLVTLAAARDREEARRLTALIGDAVGPDSALFSSPTLWSVDGPRGHPALPPFVRHMLLCELADRPDDHRKGWSEVFATLRSYAEADADTAGRLHHELALGHADALVDELTRLLPPNSSGGEWMALVDQIIAMPYLRPPGPAIADQIPPVDDRGRVARLVACLQTLADPRLSDTSRRRHLYNLVGHDYGALDRGEVFYARSARYRRLADTTV